jgi:hypothetical protein
MNIMVEGTKFIKLNDQTELVVGSLIEGYTYSPNDFHSKNEIFERLRGNAKLRTGVIIENYDNLYFKIQFRNSSALKAKNQWFVNRIAMKVANREFVIAGSEMFCIIIHRSQIVKIASEQTFISENIESLQQMIFEKHNKYKKRATMYFRKKLYLSRSESVTNKILKLYQFTPAELKMANSVIYKKLRLIWIRHISKYKCVDHEISKMKQAIKLIEDNDELYKICNMLLDLITYNHDLDYPYHFDEKNAISIIVEFFNPKHRFD